VSRAKGRNVHARSEEELRHHLERAATRIVALSAELCEAACVESMAEARSVFETMLHDTFVLGLREKRGELEFLLRRQRDIQSDLAELFGVAS